ncbi:hypothetical protein EMN47_03355 [Prolixibacteraceae bacterium JC049]|nr:hypothetical protein [Prolixibacteraceae bacterium JC049]
MKNFDQNISQLLNNDARKHQPNSQIESRLHQTMLAKGCERKATQNSMLDFFTMLFSTRFLAPKLAFGFICLILWCFPPGKLNKSNNLTLADSINNFHNETVDSAKIYSTAEDSICSIQF